MLTLVLGLAIFLGAHVVPMAPDFRNGLRDRFGANAYRIGFSVVSLLGLFLIIDGYGKLQVNPAKNPVLWFPPLWTKHLLWLLMWPALVLIIAGNIPSRIRDTVQHPMLLGTIVWSAGHLLANGSLGAIVLFGSFLAWALFDLTSATRRHARGPLGDRKASAKGDIAAIAIGTGLYAWLLLGGHAKLIGPALLR